MKKEIILAATFITLVILAHYKIPFTSLLLNLSILPITIILFLDTLKSDLWNKNKFLAIFFVYIKMITFVAITFVVLNYPGQITLNILSVATTVIFLLLAFIKSLNKKYLYTAYAYLQVSALIVLNIMV